MSASAPSSPAPTQRDAADPSLRNISVALGIIAAAVLLLAMREFQAIIAPLALSIMIVIAAHPMQGWARRTKIPSWAILGLSMTAIYGFILAMIGLLWISMDSLVNLLPKYAERFQSIIRDVQDKLSERGVQTDAFNSWSENLDLQSIAGYAGTLMSSLASVSTAAMVMLLLLLFVIVDAHGFDDRFAALLRTRPQIAEPLGVFARATRQYLVVSTVFGAIVAVLDWAALWYFAVPLPILWALLGFVTNYIPNIGFVIGVIPPVLLAALDQGWKTALWVFIAFFAINFVMQTLIQPRFVGASVGISTTVTLVSLMLWGAVMGPLGAILAVPMSVFVKVVFIDPNPRLKWMSLILDANIPDEMRRPDAAEEVAAATQDSDPEADASAADGDAAKGARKGRTAAS